ncbi:copper/zinc superoxide dismutase [Parasitella parasitica]|nr:copper/zinc superoxide dismutase [Parasitella parasitica]
MKFSIASFATALIATALSSVACKPSQLMQHETIKAIAILTGITDPGIAGSVIFTQTGLQDPTQIFANFTGLAEGKHGLHIHELGDLSNGCTSLGPHYNPFNHTHGSTEGDERHAGDFGNIVATADGTATLNLTISTVHLNGPFSVIGRGIVLHAGEDDLGLGNSPLSKTTGNSGDRLACGVIGYAASA